MVHRFRRLTHHTDSNVQSLFPLTADQQHLLLFKGGGGLELSGLFMLYIQPKDRTQTDFQKFTAPFYFGHI